jgi:pimeloyl-ACP methyl ester carboxylesterase
VLRSDPAAHVVRLSGGRRLAVAEAGPPGGAPVFYLHGAIGSPLQLTGDLAGAIEALGVRLLLVQRPGFGASDPQPGRTLLGFADDVAEAADALGVGRFAVAGVSAGGPYAIACAHRLPERVVAAAAVSSLSPLCPPADVPGLPARIRLPLRALGRWPGPAARLGDAAVGLVSRHPALLLRAMALGAPPADRSHLDDAATSRTAVDAFLAATAGGIGGLIADHLITCRPWGFDVREVLGEVHVWHGMADAFVPAEHALQLVAGLPRCRAWLDPGEGHFFFRRRVRDILGALVEPPQSASAVTTLAPRTIGVRGSAERRPGASAAARMPSADSPAATHNAGVKPSTKAWGEL